MIYQNPKETKNTPKFQEGGTMPAEGGAPQTPPTEGGDPIAELVTLAQQALASQDCQAAMALAEGFMALVAGPEQGASAPPQGAPEGEPVYRKGGTLLRRV